MLDLPRVALRMPPEYAARMVPLVINWANAGMPIEESVVSLALHLARGGQWESALALVDLLLSTREEQIPEEAKKSPYFRPRAEGRAEWYYTKTFVEQELAFFLEHYPLDVLDIAQRNLGRAVSIEAQAGKDYSYTWRSAIEPHEQNRESHEITNLLVDVIVRALDAVAKASPEQGKQRIEAYLDHSHSIFRRIAIHTVRQHAERWPNLLEKLFTDEIFLKDIAVYHEYWLLMQDAYGLLPGLVQHSFVEQLVGKLPKEGTKGDKEYDSQRCRVLRRLLAIKNSLPLGEYRSVLDNLIGEYGEPEHPSLQLYSRAVWHTPIPVIPQKFGDMSPDAVLKVLRRPLPFSSFEEPNQEDAAKILKSAILDSPQHFAPIAPQLSEPDIAPIYAYYALWGFREAWKEDKPFDWGPVLALCQKVSQTSEDPPENGGPVDMQPGYWDRTYASARKEVAMLLESGVVRDDHAIPHEYLGQTQSSLLNLADDRNPSTEYERRWLSQPDSDMLTLALNVNRSKAIEVLLQYALHVARISGEESPVEGIAFAPGSRMEVAVRDKLTEKLDKQVDPSLSVHSIYGKFLPNLHYLDRDWLVEHLDDIFPRQPEMADYWAAAWDSYLFRSDFFGYIYELLRHCYRHAIERAKPEAAGRFRPDLLPGRLSSHLAIVYWRGVETWDIEDSLIPLFFDKATDELRAGFVINLRAALEDIRPGADSEEWQRTKSLWERRIHAILELVAEGGEAEDYIKELAAYTGWVPFIPEPLQNFYPMIELSAVVTETDDTIKLVEFFASVAKEHAPFAVSILEALLQQERGPWFLGRKYKEVRTILEAAMNTGDEKALACAVNVINLFGRRGDERYRDILGSR